MTRKVARVFSAARVGIGFDCDDDALVCPRCGWGYLHRERLTWFSRGEDAKEVVVITIDGSLIGMKSESSIDLGNPSGRRGGFVVTFSCGECENRGDENDKPNREVKLNVLQHKGQTFLEWRFEP